jgi:protein-S-isoprenylcysteine O-methyltransferase Ste14
MLGLWATPQMSTGHLLLAVTFTVYIFIGLHFEERDLVKTLGKAYEDYQKRVPMLFPKL